MNKTQVEEHKYGTRRSGVISRVILSVFGYEGTLAHKYIKRNKSKHRKTLIMLMIPIIVFISVSSYANMMTERTRARTGGFDYSINIKTDGNTITQEKILEFLSAQKDLIFTFRREISERGYAGLNRERTFYSDNYKAWERERRSGGGFNCINLFGVYSLGYGVTLIAMPDEEFRKTVPERSSEVQGILLNTSGNTYLGGKVQTFKPFQITKGDFFLVTRQGGMEMTQDIGLVLVAEITTPPDFANPFVWDGGVHILISETDFNRWVELYFNDAVFDDVSMKIFIWTDDSNTLYSDITKNFPRGENSNMRYFIHNMDEHRHNAYMLRNVGAAVALAALLTAVARTFVLAAAAIKARQPEFLVLFSAGMTRSKITKMLNVEILLYTIKALVLGIPFGWLLSYGFYRWVHSNDFEAIPFRIPFVAVSVAIASILFVALIIMRYNSYQLQKIIAERTC